MIRLLGLNFKTQKMLMSVFKEIDSKNVEIYLKWILNTRTLFDEGSKLPFRWSFPRSSSICSCCVHADITTEFLISGLGIANKRKRKRSTAPIHIGYVLCQLRLYIDVIRWSIGLNVKPTLNNFDLTLSLNES